MASRLDYLFSGDPALTCHERRDRLVVFVVRVGADEVEGLILRGEVLVLTTGSVRLVAERLAEVYGVRLMQATDLLGLSERTVHLGSRAALSADHLARLLLVCDRFADVEGVLGIDDARTWFRTPNRTLNDQPPIGLLSTQVGEQTVRHLIGALLDGAYP